jgi:hypothetical protein
MKAKPIATNGHSRPLARYRQPMILTLFPDELIIEELRVIWVKNTGPFMNEIVTIMATDIASVNASSGPIFGHIHVKSLTGGPEILVDKLIRHQVFGARSLIEGIALSSREGLKVDNQNLEAERENLIRAGQVHSTGF